MTFGRQDTKPKNRFAHYLANGHYRTRHVRDKGKGGPKRFWRVCVILLTVALVAIGTLGVFRELQAMF